MNRFRIEHTTIHRYANPVTFGEHRLMFRPRDSHDLRLLSTSLEVSPKPDVRWVHDVFGNSIAILTFRDSADLLSIRSTIRLEHYGLDHPEFPLEGYAQNYPFSYSAQEMPDLSRSIERQYPDPDHQIDAWARKFLWLAVATPTQTLLEDMTAAIKAEFSYRPRYEPGVQPPAETLATRSGTCRDYALFMMEAARALGFAARFVSGYLYDPAADHSGAAMQGSGATHAWVQIYLPGAGWVEFDPTNGLIGGANLIRVGVARDPSQAIPFAGTFIGLPGDCIDEEVTVTVTAEDPAPQRAAAL